MPVPHLEWDHVEGADFDVLDGIEDCHWHLIRRISMEIAPTSAPRLRAIVAIPAGNDGPGVAARVNWTGTLVISVLNQARYRPQAIRLREEIRNANGVGLAATIVERVLWTGRPVLRSEVAQWRTNAGASGALAARQCERESPTTILAEHRTRTNSPAAGLAHLDASATRFCWRRNRRADHVVIEEIRGRREAPKRGLHLTGTLGLLAAAAEQGLIELRSAWTACVKRVSIVRLISWTG